MSIRPAASLAALLLATSACHFTRVGPLPETNDWSPGTASHQTDVNGMTRSYRLHVPAQAPRTFLREPQPWPLVIVLHGSGDDGESAEHFSRMDSIADVRGLLVVYPDATGAAGGIFGLRGADWNAGECCGSPQKDGVDDAAFVMNTIDRVSEHLPVDHKRVYVAGFSDGARLAYHVACRYANRVAAIAVVAGSLEDPACNPAVPVPLVAFHATGDDEVAYSSATGARLKRPMLATQDSLPPSVRVWAANNGCRTLTRRTIAAHVRRFIFGRCAASTVEFYAIAGGGHGWPSSPDGGGASPPMSEVNASGLITNYFLRWHR